MKDPIKTDDLTIGIVGLGLMGSSIIVSLLIAGHAVIGIAPVSGEKEAALPRIKNLLKLCKEASLLKGIPESCLSFLTISDDYDLLEHCDLVLECVTEKIEVKKAVYQKITSVIYPDTIIASNTSAMPISLLQQYVTFPERFIGIHWAEPAFATRFMEITCGDQTSAQTAEGVYELAIRWGKEPTLLKKDIKGFITNRLMMGMFGPDKSNYDGTDMTRDLSPDYFFHNAGLINLTRFMAKQLAGQNIRVNCISPGGLFNDQPKRFLENYCGKVPLGRMANRDDIKGPVVLLASRAGAYINGENILMDGGLNA